MESFGHFAAAFNDMKNANNLKINFNDSRGYFWRIGEPAKTYWQPDYETKVPNAKPIEIQGFRAMFEEGGELLGIPTGKSLGNFNGIRLYRMTEIGQSFTINNLLFSYNGTMLNGSIGSNITSPDTNELFTKPIIIKPETFRMLSSFDGLDVIASKVSGLIYGAGFRNGQRSSNRLGQESIMGTLDYRTGAINLLRSNSDNDLFAPQYQEFILGLESAASGDSSSGDSTGGTVGGGASAGLTYTSTTPAPTGSLTTIDINCTYSVFDNPVTIVWEFQL